MNQHLWSQQQKQNRRIEKFSHRRANVQTLREKQKSIRYGHPLINQKAMVNGIDTLFDITDDVLLSAEQLAERLNVAVKTIRKWRFERRMPPDCAIKVGGHIVRYRWKNVLQWLQNQGATYEHSPY